MSRCGFIELFKEG